MTYTGPIAREATARQSSAAPRPPQDRPGPDAPPRATPLHGPQNRSQKHGPMNGIAPAGCGPAWSAGSSSSCG